jgi:hypothetical protein
MRRFVKGILTVALALACSAPGAMAQTASAKSSDAVQTAAKSYRLVWTITDIDGGKTVGTQHFAMIVLSGGRTTMKLGSKIPVATGSYNSGSSAGVQTQFQYLDVGLNIDASLDEVDGGMKLNSKVEQSSVSVAEEKTVGDVREPVIRQAVLTGASIMTVGKPVMLGSLDVPGSTRHLDVEVVLENVK